MDILTLSGSFGIIQNVLDKSGSAAKGVEKGQSDLFSAMLGTAIDNIHTTNSYISDAENEELKLALGETENTHDLTIALQKASTALQYTVAIRDKFMDAYKELINMNI